MGENSAKGIKRVVAVCLTLALLTGGCSRPEREPAAEPTAVQSVPVETKNAQVESQRLSAQKAAEEKRNSYLWPQESVQKNIMGKDMEFILYHGNGWTIHVPATWEENDYGGQWEAPSHCTGFSVSKQFLGVNNPKWYRAQTGSWRHETSYAPPFDYYYDNDGGYTPPAGSADYIYFFAPDGERQSYEFTLQTIVGETSEEEMRIQEAMLLSFTLDDSSHVLKSEAYTPGTTEWEAAMAGLMAEEERIWFSWYDGGTSIETDGKGKPEYASYALALEDFCPEEFTEMFFGEKPQGGEELMGQPITLYLLDMRIWLHFYDNSPWVQISHSGEAYWARVYHKNDPDKMIFDTVRTWLEAESAWAIGSAGH